MAVGERRGDTPPGFGERRHHSREVATSDGIERPPFGILATLRANTTNSAGHDHRPNAERTAAAMRGTAAAGLSPRHWLQQRCARLMFAGSVALPPFDTGTTSSSSIA